MAASVDQAGLATERTVPSPTLVEASVLTLSNKILKGSGIYVRFANDGDKVVGVFAGALYARQVHWMGAAYEECTGKGCE